MISFLLLVLGLISSSYTAGVLVQTDKGAVQGTATTSALIWAGIPYAAPPIGNLRFAEPIPPSPWNTTLDGTKILPVSFLLI